VGAQAGEAVPAPPASHDAGLATEKALRSVFLGKNIVTTTSGNPDRDHSVTKLGQLASDNG